MITWLISGQGTSSFLRGRGKERGKVMRARGGNVNAISGLGSYKGRTREARLVAALEKMRGGQMKYRNALKSVLAQAIKA